MPQKLTKEQREAVEKLDEALDGDDPRAELLESGRTMSAAGAERRVTGRVEASIDAERGVFMISVAAELAHMHPQTLRMYEARGLIEPKRSPKNTRLYSQRDVERLRRIQRMTSEQGLNLAGVETVLELERKVERMKSELQRARERAAELERDLDIHLTAPSSERREPDGEQHRGRGADPQVQERAPRRRRNRPQGRPG